MTKIKVLPLLSVIALLVVFSGCQKGTQKDVRVLQAQVGVIADELVRLDDSLQETRSALTAEQSRYSELQTELDQSGNRISSLQEEEQVIRGIYRTPSGFELPSIQIQQALQNAGYYRGNLDGKIGPQTRDAIKSFQRDQGLNIDGVVGRQTWTKLKVYISAIK